MKPMTCALPLVTAAVPYVDAGGHNVTLVIAKSTWHITEVGLVPNEVQMPILYVDKYVGDDPAKPMLLSSDLVDVKPVAEVMIIKPRGNLERMSFAGKTLSIRVGSLAFAGEARDPWPFGPLPRNHGSRLPFAGTYDEQWQRTRMPLCPVDFDARYHLSAPASQRHQRFFAGDERMTIDGLYGSSISFSLPGKALLVAANVRQRYITELAALDTILVWSEIPALTLIWRHVIRPRQKNAEIGQVTPALIMLRTARELYG